MKVSGKRNKKARQEEAEREEGPKRRHVVGWLRGEAGTGMEREGEGKLMLDRMERGRRAGVQCFLCQHKQRSRV